MIKLDIPINAEVYCADGFMYGRSTCIVLNPEDRQVTHLVVEEKGSSHADRLIPITFLTKTTAQQVCLTCSKDTIAEMVPFSVMKYVKKEIPQYPTNSSQPGKKPIATPPIIRHVKEKCENIPSGRLAIHKGSRVKATDGSVGCLCEFQVTPEDGHITDLVLRRRRLWGKKEVVIPNELIDRFGEDTVYLSVDKRGIASLPAV